MPRQQASSLIDDDADGSIDTSAMGWSDAELPSRLYQRCYEYLELLLEVRIQRRTATGWSVLKQRIRSPASMSVDELCDTLVRIAADDAARLERDADYRAMFLMRDEAKGQTRKFAPIKARHNADGDVDIQDGDDKSERRDQIEEWKSLVEQTRSEIDSQRGWCKDMLDFAKDSQQAAQDQHAKTAEAIAKLTETFGTVGESMGAMLTAVTGMLATGVELHSAHADKQAEVQIAQLQYEADAAKWAGGFELLKKVMGPLGGQIAETMKKRQAVKGGSGGSAPAAVAATSASTETSATPTLATMPVEWRKGKSAAISAFLDKIDERCRKGIQDTLTPAVLEYLEEGASGSDDEAAENLVVIRTSISQRYEQNDYAMGLCLAKLNGILGDELTRELMGMLPDPEEKQS